MALPSAPLSGAPASEPGSADGPIGHVPRFPWISLVLLVLAIVGVITAIGLAISGGVQIANENQRAIDDAVQVGSNQRGTVEVSGPDDTVHLWIQIPGDASAWRSDGTLDYPDDRPYTASQDGVRLPLEDQLSQTDGFDLDRQTLTDGSNLVELDQVHPRRAGQVAVVTGDLSPGEALRLAVDPDHTTADHRLAAAGIVAVASILLGLIALITFIVGLVRRYRSKHPPRPPTPPGFGMPPPVYPGYANYPGQAPPAYPPPSYPPPAYPPPAYPPPAYPAPAYPPPSSIPPTPPNSAT